MQNAHVLEWLIWKHYVAVDQHRHFAQCVLATLYMLEFESYEQGNRLTH